MTEHPLITLERWEQSGAPWRTKSIENGLATVELCSCHGEAVDELRSSDPQLLNYLADRRTSESASRRVRQQP